MSRCRPAVWLLFGLALLAGVAAARPQTATVILQQRPATELRTAGNDDRDVLASTARRDRTERRLAIKVELIP